MNKKTALRILAGVIITSCATVTLAHAETSLGASGKLEVAPTMIKVDSEVDMDSDGGMMKSMESKGEIKTTISATSGMHRMDDGMKMEDGKMEMEMEKEHGVENAAMHADEHAMDSLEKVELHLEDMDALKADIDADEAKDKTSPEAEIDTADEVHSSHDFEHFIAHKAKSDERIKGVDVKDGKVTMHYALPVKFLWVWSTDVDASVSADASGNVSIAYPWYGFLMKKEVAKEDVSPTIEAEIKAEQEVGVETEARGTSTAPTMKRTFVVPHVLEAMVTAMGKVKASWNLKENVK